MVQMASIFKDMIDYKPPCKIYSVFPKEKWCLFKLKRIRGNNPYKLDTPKDLSKMCQEDLAEEKDLLCELYNTKFSLTHPYRWSPNSYVGDVQLRAFFS
jgi:hypothetical protein